MNSSNRFVHIIKETQVSIHITRYHGSQRTGQHTYKRPSNASQARLSSLIQRTPAVLEVKGGNVYITCSISR